MEALPGAVSMFTSKKDIPLLVPVISWPGSSTMASLFHFWLHMGCFKWSSSWGLEWRPCQCQLLELWGRGPPWCLRIQAALFEGASWTFSEVKVSGKWRRCSSAALMGGREAMGRCGPLFRGQGGLFDCGKKAWRWLFLTRLILCSTNQVCPRITALWQRLDI